MSRFVIVKGLAGGLALALLSTFYKRDSFFVREHNLNDKPIIVLLHVQDLKRTIQKPVDFHQLLAQPHKSTILVKLDNGVPQLLLEFSLVPCPQHLGIELKDDVPTLTDRKSVV